LYKLATSPTAVNYKENERVSQASQLRPPFPLQDEGAGGEQGRHKDREVDEGEQEDKESGK
jgi:hypothetical protein